MNIRFSMLSSKKSKSGAFNIEHVQQLAVILVERY
jgi:hypothetical protein